MRGYPPARRFWHRELPGLQLDQWRASTGILGERHSNEGLVGPVGEPVPGHGAQFQCVLGFREVYALLNRTRSGGGPPGKPLNEIQAHFQRLWVAANDRGRRQ